MLEPLSQMLYSFMPEQICWSPILLTAPPIEGVDEKEECVPSGFVQGAMG